jgi:glycosyltransferase involved in cell wall biosynthesis
MMRKCKVAIVHDYLVQMGGAERVVELFHRMFPDAPIYTTIADYDRLWPGFRQADIRTSWMQRIPGVLKRFKHYFWLYPLAIQSFDLRDYDLVLSSSSAFAKGARVSGKTLHVCYCHTPMRFAWNFDQYMAASEAGLWQKKLAKLLIPPLRRWDRANTRGVHHLIANSTVVRQRIEKYYQRSASLIHPPVNLSRFRVSKLAPGDYFLVVSRLVSYKRIDLAVEACTRAGKKLLVIGDGPDRRRLEAMAGPTVRFLGRLSDEQIVAYMQHCRALIFPGLEDFGITPLEANACGRPVLAFRGGGALDTVQPGLNGLFFDQQTAEALAEGLEHVAAVSWNPEKIRQHAEKFGEETFVRQMKTLLERLMEGKEVDDETYTLVRRFG